MENAVDALKMAFAMFVFIISISLAIHMITLARETSDIMLSKMDPVHSASDYEIAINTERIVGLETIIPSLYKYYKEEYMVVFRNSSGHSMKIFDTQTAENLWAESYKSRYGSGGTPDKLTFNTDNGKGIACFDIEEETARREPWTGNTNKYFKENLDAILKGETFIYPDGSGRTYDYATRIGTGGLIAKLQGKKFKEYIGENVEYVDKTYEGILITSVKKVKKVIIYQEQ